MKDDRLDIKKFAERYKGEVVKISNFEGMTGEGIIAGYTDTCYTIKLFPSTCSRPGWDRTSLISSQYVILIKTNISDRFWNVGPNHLILTLRFTQEEINYLCETLNI